MPKIRNTTASTILLLSLSGYALAADPLVGSYTVQQGPEWTTSPPTYTCLEGCAAVFGGQGAHYSCSTDSGTINHQAWVSTYGGSPHCQYGGGTPVAENYKSCETYSEFNCESAYVQDNCYQPGTYEDPSGSSSINYCFSSVSCGTAPAACEHSAPGAASLSIKQDSEKPAKNSVQFKWSKAGFDASDFGSPTGSTIYSLCVYDASGRVVQLDAAEGAAMCNGVPCWTVAGNDLAYKDKTKPATVQGITSIVSKADAAKGKMQLKAKGENVPAPDLGAGLVYPVTAQVRTTDASCWQAVFDSTGEKKNADGSFKATYKAP